MRRVFPNSKISQHGKSMLSRKLWSTRVARPERVFPPFRTRTDRVHETTVEQDTRQQTADAAEVQARKPKTQRQRSGVEEDGGMQSNESTLWTLRPRCCKGTARFTRAFTETPYTYHGSRLGTMLSRSRMTTGTGELNVLAAASMPAPQTLDLAARYALARR